MTLAECIDAYVAFKRSLGMRFRSEAELLNTFSRTIGPLDLAAVTPDAVRAFIAGSGPVTAFWRQKWVILRGFYRFALSRGFATASPVPVTLPQLPPPLTPYIYSSEELTRLLAATDTLQEPRCPLRALTFRTLLLLLYGTGMRIGEALSLTLPDIDVGQRLVTIRDAKFFKSRLVPTGAAADSHPRRVRHPAPATPSAGGRSLGGLRHAHRPGPVLRRRESPVPARAPARRDPTRSGRPVSTAPARPPAYRGRPPAHRLVSGRGGRAASAAPLGDVSRPRRHRLHAAVPHHDPRAAA